jgi:hypothetical protein
VTGEDRRTTYLDVDLDGELASIPVDPDDDDLLPSDRAGPKRLVQDGETRAKLGLGPVDVDGVESSADHARRNPDEPPF